MIEARWLVVLWVLASCTPPATMRPASSVMGATENELGFALVSIRPRPYANDPVYSVAQLWGSKRLSENLALSGIVAFDSQAAAAGTGLAWLPIETSRTRAGIEAELGYAWLAFALPISFRVAEGWTVHTSPRLANSGDSLSAALPIGVGVQIGAGLLIRLEGQMNWVDFKSYNRRMHWALGLAYQFGETSK